MTSVVTANSAAPTAAPTAAHTAAGSATGTVRSGSAQRGGPPRLPRRRIRAGSDAPRCEGQPREGEHTPGEGAEDIRLILRIPVVPLVSPAPAAAIRVRVSDHVLKSWCFKKTRNEDINKNVLFNLLFNI